MEILNNIWLALTTENEVLINILAVPFLLIETTVTMLLFTSLLNIKATKKSVDKCMSKQPIYISKYMSNNLIKF